MEQPNKNLALVIVLAACVLAGGGTYLFLTRNHFPHPQSMPAVPVVVVPQNVTPVPPARPVFDNWEIAGRSFAGFEDLSSFASDGGFVVIGRFGDFRWPAKVVGTHDDTNTISYQRKNGQSGKYEGYAGYHLKTVTVEGSAGGETIVVLRSKERVATVAPAAWGGATNAAVPQVTAEPDPNSVANLQLEVDRRRQLFGNESTNLADTLGLLSSVLRDEGKLTEAESVRRENLAIRRNALGNEHFRVAISLDALGTILQREGKLAEAETSIREALVIRQKIYGRQSSQARDTLARLNEVLKLQGKPTE